MSRHNTILGVAAASLLVGTFFALATTPAAAAEKGLKVAPAIYRTNDDATPAATIQPVRYYYYGGWGYYGPQPYVYGTAPIATYGYPAYGYPAYGYPAYSYPAYAYPPPAYAYPAPVYGYGYPIYGPRVSVGFGIW